MRGSSVVKGGHSATSIAAVLRRGALVGGLGSLVIHLSAVASLVAVALPEMEFELTFPVDVELGFTDATEVAMRAAAAAAASDPTSSGAGAASDDPNAAHLSGPDGGIAPDAPVPDAGIAADAGRRRRRDAGVDAPAMLVASAAAGEGEAEGESSATGSAPLAFLTAGTQVALRVDLDVVRASEVRPEVEALLAGLPDWEALLAGSDVEPVRDFSRVLIATPNFDRARIVVAGRLSPGAPSPRAVAVRMARAHGERLVWTETSGVPTARWITPDSTPRRVALIGPRHFVVASETDIERVLSIAAARSAHVPGDEPETGEPEAPEAPAEALLSMRRGEALTLEVEGARTLVGRSPCPVPTRGRLALRESATGVEISLVAHFDDEAEAGRASRCVQRYAGLGSAVFPPLAPVLSRLETEIAAGVVTLSSSMTFAELREVLAFVTARFAARRAAPAPPETPAPAAPPPDPEIAPGPPPG